MSRRRLSKSEEQGLGILVLIALIASAIGAAIKWAEQNVLVVATGALFIVGIIFLRYLWRRLIHYSLIRKVNVLINEHGKALARRRMQTLLTDSYGNVLTDKWSKEIRYFISNVVAHTLDKNEYRSLQKNYERIVGEIDRKVAALDHEREITFNPSMTPVEFEHFCAAELQTIGWDARVTKTSGDQGSDIIAEKDGIRIVLQCKLYHRPVGNRAVQEISAARLHERANGAAVVANTRYTLSAQQLAKTNDVLLLHYSELRDIDELLRTRPAGLMIPTRTAHGGSGLY